MACFTAHRGHTVTSMESEMARLGSYLKWTEAVQPSRLSRCGFFYGGSGDQVVCHKCGVEVQAWSTVDEVLERHKRESPTCQEDRSNSSAFSLLPPSPRDEDDGAAAAKTGTYQTTARQLNTASTLNTDATLTRNLPGHWTAFPDVAASRSSSRPTESIRTSGYFSQSMVTNTATAAEYTSSDGPLRLTATGQHESAAVAAAPAPAAAAARNTPKYPGYVDLRQRIESFRNKKIGQGQTADGLTKAGFFHVGPEDNVRCFQCDGGLKNWQPSDDPWTEHARWFPRCPFVQSEKDRDFIQNAQITRNNTKGSQSFRAASTSFTASSSAAAAAVGVTQYRIEPREIKARMDSTTVQTVLKMGYQRDIVRQVIERRLRSTGDDFPSTQNLLEAVFALEDELSNDQQRNWTPLAPLTEHVSAPANVIAAAASQRQPAHQRPHTVNSIHEQVKPNCGSPCPSNKDATDSIAAAPAALDPESESLLEENRELKQARRCKVCMDHDVDTVFLPCGHLVCCSNCSPELRNCAICRALIRGTVKIFLS